MGERRHTVDPRQMRLGGVALHSDRSGDGNWVGGEFWDDQGPKDTPNGSRASHSPGPEL